MKVAIGQDSHRFDPHPSEKPLVLGGVVFPGEPALLANSDGDVILHAVTNAVSGITCVNILGAEADALCRAGILDSSAYLERALEYLKAPLLHLSISVECARPRLSPRIPEIRAAVAKRLGISPSQVGLTATSGEGLTACGSGQGISVLCILTAGDEPSREEV